MMSIFDTKDEKRVPKNLNDCIRPDGTVMDLRFWAEKVEEWGKIAIALLIVAGVVLTIAEAISLIDVNEEAIVPTVIGNVIAWGLSAFGVYVVSRITALLLRALASITHHTMISANVALLEHRKNTDPEEEKPVVQSVTGKWACPDCGNVLPNDVIRCKCGFKK